MDPPQARTMTGVVEAWYLQDSGYREAVREVERAMRQEGVSLTLQQIVDVANESMRRAEDTPQRLYRRYRLVDPSRGPREIETTELPLGWDSAPDGEPLTPQAFVARLRVEVEELEEELFDDRGPPQEVPGSRSQWEGDVREAERNERSVREGLVMVGRPRDRLFRVFRPFRPFGAPPAPEEALVPPPEDSAGSDSSFEEAHLPPKPNFGEPDADDEHRLACQLIEEAQRLFEANGDAEMEPPACVCPLTLAPPLEPVVAEDGHTYERVALRRAMHREMRSPVTRAPFITWHYPNLALKAVMLAWASKTALVLVAREMPGLAKAGQSLATSMEWAAAWMAGRVREIELAKEAPLEQVRTGQSA